jgi:hypothetical protein
VSTYVYRAASGLSHTIRPDAQGKTFCDRDIYDDEIAVSVAQGQICGICKVVELTHEISDIARSITADIDRILNDERGAA